MSRKEGPLSSIVKAVTGGFRSEAKPAPAPPPAPAPAPARPTAPIARQLTLADHWAAMKASGYTASQAVDFLRPLADLEGISVSYVYEDDTGREQVYNHPTDNLGFDNPLSQAIRSKKLSKPEALKFALNDKGRVWIESNFIELK